jgi:predicted kinase
LFHAFPLWGEVEAIREIETVRLDDVAEAAGVELLKLDIQGAELLALRNAPRRLADALILHVEVEFIPLYVDQPLFSEVESFLRQSGFQFHRFLDQNIRIFSPMLMYDYLYGSMSQLLAADAIFVKDFTRLECLSDRQLIAMATILHDCYQSLDLVFRLISEYDRRNGTSLAGAYLTGLKAEVPGLGIAIGDCHSYAITRPAELPSA